MFGLHYRKMAKDLWDWYDSIEEMLGKLDNYVARGYNRDDFEIAITCTPKEFDNLFCTK